MSIMQDRLAAEYGFDFVEGGVTAPRGFCAAGVHAGFYQDPGRLDFALVVADATCAAAGVFTKNIFCAAPVVLCREHLNEGSSDQPSYGRARAVAVNAGTANAATGQPGFDKAVKSASFVADAVGCDDNEVLVASTGVIGVELPWEPFEFGVSAALDEIHSTQSALADADVDAEDRRRLGGFNAASAIMTTDTHPKECAVSFSGDEIGYPGATFSVGGMAKGSGMIMPDMATLIVVITTDAPLDPPVLSDALRTAVGESFNKVTVDSDTSTNDSCFLLSSGAAADDGVPFEQGSAAYAAFERALLQVCTTLARAIAADGEGATRLITVNVRGAESPSDADTAARTVANSPLFKAAVFGKDANWGRIAAALGRSGARFSQDRVDIDLAGLPVCRKGLPVPFDEEEALARFEEAEIVVDINLNEGDCQTTVWTCDLTYDYVSINGDYRS